MIRGLSFAAAALLTVSGGSSLPDSAARSRLEAGPFASVVVANEALVVDKPVQFELSTRLGGAEVPPPIPFMSMVVGQPVQAPFTAAAAPVVSVVAAKSGSEVQSIGEANKKEVVAQQVVLNFTLKATEQTIKEHEQPPAKADPSSEVAQLHVNSKPQTNAGTALRGSSRLVPLHDTQGNSTAPIRAVMKKPLAPTSYGLTPLGKLPMHTIAHFLDRVEPAGLIHQKCSCEFRGLCSCQAAIEFMDCVAAACQSGECDCEETQFEHACTTISSECSTLEMECSAERATCLIEEATESYRLNRTVNDTYDDLRELKEQKCRLEVAEEDGWLNAKPRLEVVEADIAKKIKELKAQGAPLPEMHCEKHFEEWHPEDPAPVKSVASPPVSRGVCASLLVVLVLVGL